ncbi:MAG: hypothetical protein DYG99_16550, partial [Bacteroidetes bacterium CHB5]|nr:hypothetical protein [Bacteroidetes bacterium CHB5]
VSVPLVRTFFIETPDDPNYSGYNVTMTWAGREGILVNGGGIRPHYRQTGGSPSISQAGFGDDMLGLWSLASFGRMAYDESRSYGLVRSTKAMYDEYKSIRAFNSAYKVGRQTQLLSNISSNLNALDVIKAGSKRMAFVGLAVGAVDMANKGFTNESMALFAADAVMSYVAFLGPVGAGAAAIYFTGRFVYDLYQASQNGK